MDKTELFKALESKSALLIDYLLFWRDQNSPEKLFIMDVDPEVPDVLELDIVATGELQMKLKPNNDFFYVPVSKDVTGPENVHLLIEEINHTIAAFNIF